MTKVIGLAVLVPVGLVAPAHAEKPRPHAPRAASATLTKPKRTHCTPCTPRAEPTSASGTLVTAKLRPRGRGRYGGTLEVNVTRANHHAILATNQSYRLSNSRVTFHRGVNRAAPGRGSRINVTGTITVLPSAHCLTATFSPTITVKKVDVKAAR